MLGSPYTIESIVIFPVHAYSMNQRRGTIILISDRWDLTLECIRRHYAGGESPLSKVIETDKSFYDLFVDFKGYVDFFFSGLRFGGLFLSQYMDGRFILLEKRIAGYCRRVFELSR